MTSDPVARWRARRLKKRIYVKVHALKMKGHNIFWQPTCTVFYKAMDVAQDYLRLATEMVFLLLLIPLPPLVWRSFQKMLYKETFVTTYAI